MKETYLSIYNRIFNLIIVSNFSFFLFIDSSSSFLEHANRSQLLTHTRLFIYDFESKRISLNRHVFFIVILYSIIDVYCPLGRYRHAKPNIAFDLG